MAFYNLTNLSTYDVGAQAIAVNNYSSGLFGFFFMIIIALIVFLAASRKYNENSSVVAALWISSLAGYFLGLLQLITPELYVLWILVTGVVSVTVIVLDK